MVALFALLAHAQPIGKQSAAHEWVLIEHRMRSWESRFDCVRFSFSASNTPTIRGEFVAYPGAEELCQNGSAVWEYRAGVSTRLMNPGPIRKLGLAYGSLMEMQIASTVAGYRAILFSLGVLAAGDRKLSDVLSSSVERRIFREGRLTKVLFKPADNVTLTYFVAWENAGDAPSEVGFDSTDLHVRRRYNWTRGQSWPVTIQEAARSTGRPPAAATYIVEKPRPVISTSSALAPRDGDDIVEENYNVEYIQGSDGGFDESAAEETLRVAIAHGALDRKASRDLLCGPDSLYYFLALVGKPVAQSDLLSQLPEVRARGSSFFDLQQAAKATGVELRGVNLTLDQLMSLSTPAILATRPAHFVVLVPGGNFITVIDPPNSVREFDRRSISLLWTGEALVEAK